MLKKFSLMSSEESESESEVFKIKKEVTSSLDANQKSKSSDVTSDEKFPKSRAGRSLRRKAVQLQIYSDASMSEGNDSDYEPDVSITVNVGKRKRTTVPKNIKRVKPLFKTKGDTCSSSIILPSPVVTNDGNSEKKSKRAKRTRWDCLFPVKTETKPLPVKSEKDEFLCEEDEAERCAKKIKTENVMPECLSYSYTGIKDEPDANCEAEISKSKNEKRKRVATSRNLKRNKSKIKVENASIKTETDEAFSSFTSTEFKFSLSEAAGSSENSKDQQPLAKWSADPEGLKTESLKSDTQTLKLNLGEETEEIQVAWEEARVLAEDLGLQYRIAKNIARLLDEDNTIPFIARYRKEMTGNMSPEDLRKVKEAYETLKLVKTKAVSLMNTVKKLGKLTPMVEREIRSARSMSELEHIKVSYKTAAKGTLADRARELGLETPAIALLFGNSVEPLRLEQFICHQRTKGLATWKEVETGFQHIIADIISKDREIQDRLRELKGTSKLFLSCTKSKSASKAPKKSPNSKKSPKEKASQHKKDPEENENKYQNYFNFRNNIRFIRPHQVLAINRGEKNKILSVKVEANEHIKNELYGLVQMKWLQHGLSYPLRFKVIGMSFDDAYERLIFPLLVRSVRSELTQMAETASVEVFASNLKNLLLQPPFRGKVVIGLDPGFKNGCKVCVISETGDVLHTDVIYPKFGIKFVNLVDDIEAMRLKHLVVCYRCETIALGNGTACRETEEYLSNLIQLGWFKPVDIVYTIVSEQGASIYSCSPEAKKEFPKMDTNLISAVSIARRLQDPLTELVKIEARHLGVGMYQHDIPDTKLRSTLDEVVVECVSFVGVDLNAASHCILRKIAGLNAAKAQNILDWRNTNGPFRNREQLKQVKGIGTKSFEQCAGFVRILLQTCFVGSGNSGNNGAGKEPKGKKAKTKEVSSHLNPLDSTWIHPESYGVAERIVRRCGADLRDIGAQRFIEQIKRAVANIGIQPLSMEMNISEETTKLVTDGLTQLPDHDLRNEFKKPLFRRGVKSLEDLQPGDILSGIVRNTTHFGAFIDIGVGRDGLLPSARLKYGITLPQLGDKVEVQIVQVEIQRKRITLDFVVPNQ